MALTVQLTDINTTGTAFTFAAAGDDLWLRSGVAIVSSSGIAISSSLGSHSLFIDGDVIAQTLAISLTGGNDVVVVGETATVVGFESGTSNFGGISFSGGGSELTNLGTIVATNGHGVILTGGDNDVINSGSIQAGNVAVYVGLFGGVGDSVINTGIISGGSTSVAINGGTGHAIFIDGNDATIVNSGSILAVHSAGGGIGIGRGSRGDGAEIRNSGDIVSADWYGIDAEGLTGSGITLTKNTGLISGDEGSYLGHNGIDTLINAGTMIGGIELNGGSDLYYGRYGSVEGDILLGAGNDTASGGVQGERIEGGDGIDRIFGFGGDDNLFGDAGNDVLRGGDGDDGLNGGIGNDDLGGGAGNDTLLGADGNDLLRGDAGGDVMNGGDGFDRASYRDSKEGITLDLADTSQSTGFAEGDSYVSIEAYEATNFNDIMLGNDVNNLLRGYDGDDQISGRGGNDNLQGFDGDDILSGGTGNDTLNGGDGDDVAAFTGDLADYTFTLLGNGNIRVEDTVGSDGVDVLIAVEFVTFGGGAEIDVMGLI
jgi:Ca2+-binding RTX toxin-like protein